MLLLVVAFNNLSVISRPGSRRNLFSKFKLKWRDRKLNPGLITPQAKSLKLDLYDKNNLQIN